MRSRFLLIFNLALRLLRLKPIIGVSIAVEGFRKLTRTRQLLPLGAPCVNVLDGGYGVHPRNGLKGGLKREML